MKGDHMPRPIRKRTERAYSPSGSEEERDLVGSDTEYNGRPRRDPKGQCKRHRPSKAAKAESNPANGHNDQRSAPGAVYQRQPSFRVISDVHTTPVWQACVAKVNRLIDSDRAQSSKTYAASQRRKLYDLNGDWAVIAAVDDGEERPHGGPCAGCVDAEVDCIVKLSWCPIEAAHMVTTRCIRCFTDHTSCSCDLRQPPSSLPTAPPSSPTPGPPSMLTTPSRPATSLRPITRTQPAAATMTRCQSDRGPPAQVAVTPTSEATFSSPISTGITRLRKFHERAGTILTQGGAVAMEYEAILMFEQGEEAIKIIEEYQMGRTDAKDRCGKAVDYMWRFAKELRSMISPTEAWNFRVEGMFSTIETLTDELNEM